MNTSLIIGSRGSQLALWQAESVKAQLEALHPQTEIRIEIIKTSGDVLIDVPLAVIGGRGAFTKELEKALLDRRIDLAVHSLKDLPTILPAGLQISAVTKREDARDALVLPIGKTIENMSLAILPFGSCVGTSSMRRAAQLKYLRPDVFVKDLRGNVDTRLRKLDAGEYDAIILATAGLRRLGFTERISTSISPEVILPAVSQGALGIETRVDDPAIVNLITSLEHAPTRSACEAERALLRALGGGCQVPIAAHAVELHVGLRLEGLVAAPSGDTVLREAIEGDASEAAVLGETLARRLLECGAASLLAELNLQAQY
jgi:hydroxymethylbilane synthase